MENNSRYTEPVIKGEKYRIMLPEGIALILEGGGTRGFFSAGVLDAFMESGVMFPYIAGVSAGAANALSYVSGQFRRNRVLLEKYVGLPQYLGYRNLLTHRSMFGYDFVFKTVPERHLFWDKDVFDQTQIRLLTGAIDCKTGETVWFEKQEVKPGFEVTRASCSIPLVSKMVEYGGFMLLDGGVASPIPIEKSIEDGNRFHVIVLTRNAGYEKPPFKHKAILRLVYGKYPKLVEALLNRHKVYNRQLLLCEQLSAEGKALIIRPQQLIEMESTNRSIPTILRVYDEGYEEGLKAIDRILSQK